MTSLYSFVLLRPIFKVEIATLKSLSFFPLSLWGNLLRGSPSKPWCWVLELNRKKKKNNDRRSDDWPRQMKEAYVTGDKKKKKVFIVEAGRRTTIALFTTVLSQWDFSHGKFGLPSPGKSQLRQSRATQPTAHAGCFSVSIIHRTLTWTTGSLTCAQINVSACDCTRECTDARKRVCTESGLWEKNPSPHRGNRTCVGGVTDWRSWRNWATFPPTAVRDRKLTWALLSIQLFSFQDSTTLFLSSVPRRHNPNDNEALRVTTGVSFNRR